MFYFQEIFLKNFLLKYRPEEEVSMKCSVTEIDRGGVYEMDGHTMCQKIQNATKIDINSIRFLGQELEYVIKFYPSKWYFHFFCTFSIS